MNIAKILRSSLPVVFVHLSTFGQAQASESLPSIDALYSSSRPTAARKEAVSSVQPVVKSPEAIRPLPPVIRPASAKPTPAVRKPVASIAAAPAQKSTPTVGKTVANKPEAKVPQAPSLKIAKAAPDKKSSAAPARVAPIISETLPVIGEGPVTLAKAKIGVETKIKKPKVASPDSLNNPSVAKKLDISKLSIFGPQAMSFRYDPRMVRAMEIASARAYGRSQGSCWRYVKNALLTAGLVDSRPTTAYAKEAAYELTTKYGFRKISCSDPYKAPIGSVLVYGGKGAGHVEFRTRSGFVSDFTTPRPSKRPLIGVYVK
jgi:hypothetical protein